MRITYLFDGSSIVNLVKRGLTKIFLNGATLDLALYESINAIWKEFALLKRITEDTALDYIDVTASVFRAIEKLDVESAESEVFKLASKENTTIYDTSYLYVSIKHDLTLVTDDGELRKRASKYVNVISSRELAEKYLKQ